MRLCCKQKEHNGRKLKNKEKKNIGKIYSPSGKFDILADRDREAHRKQKTPLKYICSMRFHRPTDVRCVELEDGVGTSDTGSRSRL